MDLSTDGRIEAEAGAVVEISVHLMAEEPRPQPTMTGCRFGKRRFRGAPP